MSFVSLEADGKCFVINLAMVTTWTLIHSAETSQLKICLQPGQQPIELQLPRHEMIEITMPLFKQTNAIALNVSKQAAQQLFQAQGSV